MDDDAEILKELEWIGSSRKDMKALPTIVQRAFGYALYLAQLGDKPPEAKPLHGFGGAGVLELKITKAIATALFTPSALPPGSMSCMFSRKRQRMELRRQSVKWI